MANSKESTSIYRVVVWLSYVGLLSAYSLSTLLWPNCARQPSVTIWLLHIAPLLLFAPTIIKRKPRGYIWLCFICLGYFLLEVPIVMYCPDPLAITILILIVLLFISAMLYVRQARN